MRKKFRLIGGSLLATALISYLGYKGVDFYYEWRVEQRRDQYNNIIIQSGDKGKLMLLPQTNFTLLGKIMYANGVERVEKGFEKGLEGLIDYIEKNKGELIKLTNSDTEVGGYIEKRGDSYSIKLISNPNIKLAQYLDELLDGNFIHKEEILKPKSMTILAFFTEGHSVKYIYNALGIIEGYYSYIKLPEEVKRKTPIIQLQNMLGDYGETDPQGLNEAFEEVKRQFGIVKKYLKGMSPRDLNPIFFNNPNLYATFHTHPKNCVDCGPSPPDKINPYIAGPDILFYQSNGKLHVFAIQKGKSREIYAK